MIQELVSKSFNSHEASIGSWHHYLHEILEAEDLNSMFQHCCCYVPAAKIREIKTELEQSEEDDEGVNDEIKKYGSNRPLD